MSVILDTDHCIAILRGQLDIANRLAPGEPVFITAISVSELVYGAQKSTRPEYHTEQVETLLQGATVLPLDQSAATTFGKFKAQLQRDGNLIADPDLYIASIALTRHLPIATHNQRHFDRIPNLALTDWIA